MRVFDAKGGKSHQILQKPQKGIGVINRRFDV
jgi:hypothetical protein